MKRTPTCLAVLQFLYGEKRYLMNPQTGMLEIYYGRTFAESTYFGG